jgi:hypothetical protein
LDPLAEIRNRLKQYPHVQIRDDGDRIEVTPSKPDGFPVSFYKHGDEFTVGYAGWHETFSEPEEALTCFAFGLSSDCRLLVTCRGRFEYRWVVERRMDGLWTKIDETGLLVPIPFWRPKSIKILSNDMLAPVEQKRERD